MTDNKLPADSSAMTLGVIGLIIALAGCCCGLFAVASVILGIIGLLSANKSIKEYALNPDAFSKSSYSSVQTAKILNILSIILGAVITLIYILYFAFYGVLITHAFKEAYKANNIDDDFYYDWEEDTISNDLEDYEVLEDTLVIDSLSTDELRKK